MYKLRVSHTQQMGSLVNRKSVTQSSQYYRIKVDFFKPEKLRVPRNCPTRACVHSSLPSLTPLKLATKTKTETDKGKRQRRRQRKGRKRHDRIREVCFSGFPYCTATRKCQHLHEFPNPFLFTITFPDLHMQVHTDTFALTPCTDLQILDPGIKSLSTGNMS